MGKLQLQKKQTQDFGPILESIERFYREASKLKAEHIPVSLNIIDVDKIPDVELYLKEKVTPGGNVLALEPRFKVFRKKGLYLSQAELKALHQNGVDEVYLLRSDMPAFTAYIDRLLSEQPSHSPMADEKKVTLLRNSAMKVMTDIFETPSKENIERGVKVVSNFVYTLMRDPKAYEILLSLSSHDHYTLQHSVGVATNAIILAKKMGIEDEVSLIEVGVGGLLHDIGKTKVKKEIINKKGPLDEEEWGEMRQHALLGYEMIKDNPNIGTRAKLAILQHHEEPGGTGYPIGLSGNQIDIFAQIVCLADIYNALTTDRSYSSARSPYDAFQLIKSKLSHKIDPKLFEALVKIYGHQKT